MIYYVNTQLYNYLKLYYFDPPFRRVKAKWMIVVNLECMYYNLDTFRHNTRYLIGLIKILNINYPPLIYN